MDKQSERTVWAGTTADNLADYRAKIKELDDQIDRAQKLCNHTFEDGRSAIKDVYDDWGGDGGFFHRCSVCLSVTY